MNTAPAVDLKAVVNTDDFVGGYSPRPELYDEMIDSAGALRPHWTTFVNLLGDLGPIELLRRWENAKRLIHENGVTYNVYGEENGMDRPWSLDSIPLILGETEWNRITDGLTQRATLMNVILADVYGPQRLLTEGWLPPELIYANPAFLRPCFGVKSPANRWLHLYAADLGRSSDGQIWVMGDRTQAPSGAGYALENRIALARALPDVFRDCRVQRVAAFFATVRQSMAALAPAHQDNPRIVLLTPGPYNETYFEHAYLARYLGYTLVQGGDLTVRDNKVYLKTLGGLQQIDVILRRVDDDYCDPLELRGDSFLGVAGQLESVRTGNVAVANALGTGIVQSMAFMPFYPGLCKHLLSEELKLPSVRTWWCGQKDEMQYVLSHLDRIVVKPTFPARAGLAKFGGRMTRKELDELTARIRACPSDYIAQEQIELSTVPSLVERRLEPRQAVMRAYLTASGDSYTAMPGGLTRFTASSDSLVVSMQRGGGSKDTWILGGDAVGNFSLMQPHTHPLEITRGGGDLPSRVADNLFWLGRYVERAEGLVRLSRGIVQRLADQIGLEITPELAVLMRALTHPFGDRSSDPAGNALLSEREFLAAMFDTDRQGSLRATIGALHGVARIVRDRISIDTWRILQGLHEDFESSKDAGRQSLSEVLALLNRLVLHLSGFGGLVMDSMTRGQAWRFLDMGRRLERSLHTLRLARATLVGVIPNDGPLLEAVLEIADSTMTYRRRYLATLQAAPVLDLLLADETNPRSISFQIARLDDHLTQLPGDIASSPLPRGKQIIYKMLSEIRRMDVRVLVEASTDHRRGELNRVLSDLLAKLPQLSDEISQVYLSHAVASHQLTGPQADATV